MCLVSCHLKRLRRKGQDLKANEGFGLLLPFGLDSLCSSTLETLATSVLPSSKLTPTTQIERKQNKKLHFYGPSGTQGYFIIPDQNIENSNFCSSAPYDFRTLVLTFFFANALIIVVSVPFF